MSSPAWLLPLALAFASGCSEIASPSDASAGGPHASSGGGPGATTSGTGGQIAGNTAGGLAGSGGDAAVTGGETSVSGSAGKDATAGSAGSGGAAGEPHWVGTWATGCQITEEANLPPVPELGGHTLRQIVRVSIGGSKLRVRVSNEYGTAPVTLDGVHVARATTGSSIDTATDVALSFSGSASVTIPAKQAVASDPFDFALAPLGKVALTIAFGAQTDDVTGHPGSRTTSYLQAGQHLSAPSLSGSMTDHWYFISGIDVMAPASSGAIAILGDSITDGRGSTTNGNDRWPDRLAERLQADPTKQHIAVLNLGIGGNALASGGLGPTGMARFESQILAQPGVRWVLVLEGVNDIGTGASTNDLTTTFQTLIDQARAKGLSIYGIPILPFAGNAMYDAPATQLVRTEVNAWISQPGHFDLALPLDEAVSDGEMPPALQEAYDSGDLLHLTPAGYQRLADAVDLSLF